MTLADDIIAVLRGSKALLDDDQLAARFGVRRQAVNQACRKLEHEGRIIRQIGAAGKIVNRLAEAGGPAVAPPAPRPDQTAGRRTTQLLDEDSVKRAIKDHLEAGGWQVRVAWGRERGVDVEARRDSERLVIEAKGEAANPPQQVNYFLGALGELIQRMDDAGARYGLALPGNPQYRGLVGRLPPHARQRLGLEVLFVCRVESAFVVEHDAPPATR